MLNISEAIRKFKTEDWQEANTLKKYVIWDSLLPSGEFVALLYIQAKDRTEAISS